MTASPQTLRRTFSSLLVGAVLGVWGSAYMYLVAYYDSRLAEWPFQWLVFGLSGVGIVALVIWPRRARGDSMSKALRIVFGVVLAAFWCLVFSLTRPY